MGIERVNSRIADIQSRMIAMQTAQAATVAKQGTATQATAGAGATFASYLTEAVSSSASAPAAPDKKYKLNGKGIPEDLAAYGNGKVPKTALHEVGNTGHKLWAPAAQKLEALIADAKRDGVTIKITDSYRPYEEQVDLARRKGLYSQGGLAAKPGTSEHGWGMAADLDLNAKALNWMRANAEKYGFDENVPRESWHWAFKPKT